MPFTLASIQWYSYEQHRKVALIRHRIRGITLFMACAKNVFMYVWVCVVVQWQVLPILLGKLVLNYIYSIANTI